MGNNLRQNILLLFLSLSCISFFSQAFAQTYTLTGKVSSSGIGVKEALVTFINNSDTTIKFSDVTDASGNYQINVVTSTGRFKHKISEFSLAQNYPNPFSSSTSISYKLKTQSKVQVTIFDVLGREIKQFSLGFQTQGIHRVVWNGKNELGENVAPGIYFYRLRAGKQSLFKKMIINPGVSNFNLSQPGLELSKQPESNNYSIDLEQETFTARIENIENTSPFILNKQIDNITFKNDTTINFTVEHLPTVSINFDSLHQKIRGFGAANIRYWYPDMTPSEIQTAFGTGYGELGFTILRLMVDPNINSWGQNIATAKAAYDMGVTIFASPWNAPAEMTEVVGNRTRVRPDMYAAYAAYLDSFATFMANNGVPLYCISIQNEPDWGEQGGWTDWTDNEMFTFMRDYAQLITATRVIGPESLQFRRQISDPILNDSTACANLDILGGHIYGGGLAPYPLAEQKGKEIWMTEHYTESANSANLWPLALNVATEIHNVMNVGWNAYIWWQIVRYYSPISDGETEGDIKGTVTKRGYIMSQFSKFIRPGDYRVESSLYPSDPNIRISAYRDSLSSKEVIIAINTGSVSENVVFTINRATTSFTPFTTSEFKSVTQDEEVNISSDNIIINLDASSITTFIAE